MDGAGAGGVAWADDPFGAIATASLFGAGADAGFGGIGAAPFVSSGRARFSSTSVGACGGLTSVAAGAGGDCATAGEAARGSGFSVGAEGGVTTATVDDRVTT
jgi:hypothetical protein